MPDKFSYKLTEMLPLLASIYGAGHLAPFIGAGMSRKKLVGWDDFVLNLETKAGIRGREGEHPEIRAQRAAAKIRHSSNETEFIAAIRESLKSKEYESLELPAQTAALAAIYWPLTISTNYDDFFYGACRRAFDTRLNPLVLGRSASDCKRVMSSLVSPFDREIVWHIQGFLGGQDTACPVDHSADVAPSPRLQNELVIGHSEYRRVSNTAVHFRRCFGEVFRTRSFLFLGSSLSEEYFWNLFGEMLELCGPSSVPHFALIESGEKVDIGFLAAEMNIAVLRYEDHSSLPSLLGDLKKLIECPKARISRWTWDTEKRTQIEIAPHSLWPGPTAKSADSAVAVVVRKDPAGRFQFDSDPDLQATFKNLIFGEGEHVVSPEAGFFAVRARTENPNESDSVDRAVRELLGKVDRECKVLHLYFPSDGGTVPPVYGFMEAVRAYGIWTTEEHASSPRLVVYVGPQVMLNLTSGQINLQELLTSRLIRFWTAVNENSTAVQPGGENISQDGDREPIRRVLYSKPSTRLSEVLIEVLGDIGDVALEKWSISLCPSPQHDSPSQPVTARSLAGRTLCDVGIVFGSVLTLDRIPSLGRPDVKQAVAGQA